MGDTLVAIVLAAGHGTRMRSERNKVLHELLGKPMAAYPIEAALGVGAERVVVVVGHQGEAVREALDGQFPEATITYVTQPEPLGTGHAVQCAIEATEGADTVLILCGDTPALDTETLAALRKRHVDTGAGLTVVTFHADDPTGYGRVVSDPMGRPRRIVEHRDATETERKITDLNAGIYMVSRAGLVDALREGLGTDNAQGELYLTDIVAYLANRGAGNQALRIEERTVVAGVNDRAQLAQLEAFLQGRHNRRLMAAGVSLQDPDSIRVETTVAVGADTTLGPGVALRGATRIGAGCTVETGCVLTDCVVGDGVHIKPYVVAEQATLDDGVVAGPFTHLRPGTHLATGSKVGNFVEIKKTHLGEGSKANHLSYLGDCEIGRDVNVGAGTITCNYDGFDKHKTVLEDGVFVGSDTQLVAPVRVGRNATVAAGSTVTRDVPEGALAVSRTPQSHKDGYYERRRKPRADARAQKDTDGPDEGGG